MGTLQGLLRDVSTPRGLPLANWDKATFDQVAGTLESNFHIPKDWFYDQTNTYDDCRVAQQYNRCRCFGIQLESC